MKPELVMLIGFPASGKSTIANEFIGNSYIWHSSDMIREELFGDVNSQVDNTLVFKTLHERIRRSLSNGDCVVMDATNLSMKRRRGFIRQYLHGIDCKITAVVLATPFNECVRRDKARDRTVGHEVLDRMYKSFNFPLLQEGFDEIEIRYNIQEQKEPRRRWEGRNLYDELGYDIDKQIKFLCNVGQNNSNHTMTIGNHCLAVSNKLKGDNLDFSNIDLFYTGLLHDFGKLKTVSFKNSKGEYSSQAHYYGHENVSAYDAMFYMFGRCLDTNRVCQIINYHMKPHLLKEEKSINKFKKFVGEEFWKDLVLFNEADKMGR